MLFCSHEYPPFPTGGIGSYTASMARALARRGHEVHVLSCVRGQRWSDVKDGDVFVHRRDLVGAPRALLAQRMAAILSCRRAADDLGVEFDVVESPDHMAEGLAFATRYGPMLVAYAHDSERIVRTTRMCDVPEWMVLRRAALVRVPSRHLADHLVARGWVRRGAAHVTPPPIELENWQPTDARATRPVMLVAGRLDVMKTPEIAVRAAAVLRRDVPELELRIVGKSLGQRDGQPYGEWLQSLAKGLDVEARFLPEVGRADLASHYAEARVVVVPSRVENLPMVALEAMACGRPVVGTMRSGLVDLLDGSTAGAVVPHDDPPALARAALPFLADASTAQRAGERARALVAERHEPNRAAAMAEALFERAVGRRRR